MSIFKKDRNAVLALEDGSVFRGFSFGAKLTVVGEGVFNTGMTGYQETLTDPSYFGQIVTMTSPQIGNYGTNQNDEESNGPKVSGFVIRELSPISSNWRSTHSLSDYLEKHGIPGIEGVDTRAITKKLRTAGSLRACLSTENISDNEAIEKAQESESILGKDYVKEVTCSESFVFDASGRESIPFTVDGTHLEQPEVPDLAPTFLEAGKVKVPEVMSAKSLWIVLKSKKDGQVDPIRDAVITGRERHVFSSRPGYLPYPQRAIRTKDFQFVINFKPDRWPLGDPYLLDTPKEPGFALLENQTFVTLADEDAGPTKAWIVTNRKDPKVKPFFEHAYGKRPREELYDMKKDPDQMKNLAQDPAYAKTVKKLRSRLMNYLSDHNDPRLVEGGKFFETSPMTDAFKRPGKPSPKPSPKK